LRRTTLALASALTLGMAAPAVAQIPAAGEVSGVEGTAAVARAAAPQGTPIKIRDDLFLRDLVTTGQQSKAQLLLGPKGGSKATVTMREQSSVRITETPGVSTVEMREGLLKLTVVKDRLKAGERVDVRTPNAITAVRGTTIVVEVVKAPSGTTTTRVTVLNGFVEITPIDPLTGAPRGVPVGVNDLQQTSVTGTGAPTPPQLMSRGDAIQLDASFAFRLRPRAVGDDLLRRQLEQATSDATKLQDTTKVPGTADTGPTVSGDDIRSRTTPVPTPSSQGTRTNPRGQ